MKGDREIVGLLVDNGAEIDKTSPAGIGPLYLAIKAVQLEVIEYLLSKGAQIYFSDPIRVDYSPIFIAIKTDNVKVVEALTDHADRNLDDYMDSQEYTPFPLALKHSYHDVIHYLSLRKCDLNQEDPQNKTRLMYYILNAEDLIQNENYQMRSYKLLDYARRYIARGANVNHTSATI